MTANIDRVNSVTIFVMPFGEYYIKYSTWVLTVLTDLQGLNGNLGHVIIDLLLIKDWSIWFSLQKFDKIPTYILSGEF